MTSRILALRKSLSKLFEPRKYATHSTYCDAHMNELPIPCGPFDIMYKDNQTFYNQVLVGGIIWWIFSLCMLIYTDSIYLNWSPPAQPGPPSDMVEECDDSD